MTKTAVSKEQTLSVLKKTDESGKTALFYGFVPVEAPKLNKHDLEGAKGLDPEWHPAEKSAILRTFGDLRGNSIPQPLMLYLERPFAGGSERKKPNRIECELVMLGSYRSVCECILIQTARAILENSGWKNLSIKLNSVGSKESVVEFERKMSAYVRKRLPDFPNDLRQSIKKDLFFLSKNKDEKYKEWTESAPQSVDYLSEQSRLHLKDALEFMETVELPYEMDTSLLGDLEYCSEIVFEICSEEGEVLAKGTRWNRLSKKMEYKREIPAVSVSISAKALKHLKSSPLKIAKPNFFLIQFGSEAKQKSFLALEKLRKAGINVSHSLAKDKLTGQMFSAEQASAPYILLIGLKEAIENVVVIRNSSTRAQFTVPLDTLGDFIKKNPDLK